MENFQKHEVVWTREKINNFWNYFVANEGLRELSAAKINGKEIVKNIRQYITKDGDNLDYGCGAGDLMGYLFEAGIKCQGLDSSQDSLAAAEKRFGGHNYFQGTILSADFPHQNIKDNTYDFVFVIETLEHLIEEELSATLKELNRIIKTGGYLFVSVPNNEKLAKYKVICPDCGAVFHRVQHMNSFTGESLNGLMTENSFTPVFCRETFLGKDQSVYAYCKYFINYWHARLFNKKLFTPHLIYLGRKSAEL